MASLIFWFGVGVFCVVVVWFFVSLFGWLGFFNYTKINRPAWVYFITTKKFITKEKIISEESLTSLSM